MESRYGNEQEVSRLTGRAVQSLRNDRFVGKGFPYVKVGASVRYNLAEVMAIMESHKVTPGGDA